MTIKCSCVLAGHGRPITSESSVTPLFIQQPYARDSAFAIVYGCFSRIKKMLGRTEMRTRDRMYCQTIRSVWDISRGDRARIATCSLRTSPDRLTDRPKANYSIDVKLPSQWPIIAINWWNDLLDEIFIYNSAVIHSKDVEQVCGLFITTCMPIL